MKKKTERKRLPLDPWQVRAKQVMADRQLTYDILAERFRNPRRDSPVTPGAISHWINGAREINLSDFLALSDVLGIKPETLLFGIVMRRASDRETLTKDDVVELVTSILQANPNAASPLPSPPATQAKRRGNTKKRS